jgi:hypothetical protein
MSASIVLNTFEHLGKVGARAEVLRRLDQGCRDRLANLLGSEWVALADHLAVYQATLEALGSARSYEVWRDIMLITLQKGLYSKLWLGLGRVNKGSPLNFYRHSGAGWAMATKGCGVQAWEGDQRRGVLMWSDLPRSMVESVGFCSAMRAKVEAVLIAAHVDGSVEELRRDVDAGVLHVQSTWRP